MNNKLLTTGMGLAKTTDFEEKHLPKSNDIIYSLLGPKGKALFETAGFKLYFYCKGLTSTFKGTPETTLSVDYFTYGKDFAIAIQVEPCCQTSDIIELLEKMTRFKKHLPEHADKEVLAGIAAVYFEDEAYDFAKENGLIIIHVKEDSVFELEPDFTLDPVPDKNLLRRF